MTRSLLYYLHTYIHTYLPTYLPTSLPTYVRTYLPTYLPTSLPTYVRTYVHTYIPTYVHTCIHCCIHTFTTLEDLISPKVGFEVVRTILSCKHGTLLKAHRSSYSSRGQPPHPNSSTLNPQTLNPNVSNCINPYLVS